MSHTPGPWKVGMGSIGGPTISGVNPDKQHPHRVIASLPSRYLRIGGSTSDPLEASGSEEIAANARLIAAAPDLLEACQAFVASHDAASKVLAKAFDYEPKGSREMQNLRAAIAKATGEFK